MEFYTDALRFLEFSFNGATLLLAVLAFRLLSAEQKRTTSVRPDILTGLRLYRNFALLTSALMLIAGPVNIIVNSVFSPVRYTEFKQCRDKLDMLEVDPATDLNRTALLARDAHAECASLMSTLSSYFRE